MDFLNSSQRGGGGGGEEEGAPLPINPPVHLPFPFPHLKNKAEYVRRLNIDCLKCHVQILYGDLGVGGWILSLPCKLIIIQIHKVVTKTRLWTILKNKHFSWNSLRKSWILASLVHMSKENNFSTQNGQRDIQYMVATVKSNARSPEQINLYQLI